MSSVPDLAKSRLARGALIGLAILGTGGWAYVANHPGPAPAAVSPRDCTKPVPVKVVSSTEKGDVLADLAKRYNAASRPADVPCGRVSVVEVSSGIAEELLTAHPPADSAITDDDRAAVKDAQVWAPSAALWLDRLDLDNRNQTSYRKARLDSLASSPLVLAMPAALQHERGWDAQAPTWRAAFDALRDGKLNYTQENPRTSTSGALATYLTYAAAQEDATGLSPARLTATALPGLNGFVREVQAAANGGFMNDSVDILRSWSQPDGMPEHTMIMIQEQMVQGFNSGLYARFGDGKPPVPLVAVHPVSPGPGPAESIVAEHPYVKLPAATVDQSAVADDFRKFVLEEAWGPLCDAGFRPPIGRDEDRCAGRTYLGTKRLGLPDAAVQSTMVDTWRNLRSQRRIMIAMDVSGSMKGELLREAADAVNQGVARLRPTDQVEIYRFAGSKQFTGPYWPVRPLADRGEHPEQEAALRDLGDMSRDKHSTAMSGVYRTVDELYEQVADRHKKDANALDVLIVLSDGIEDWNDNRRSPRAVCGDWKAKGPVPVYTIHYPPGINYTPDEVARGVDALGTFASCSGVAGAAKDSTEKESMRKIFSQVLGSV
jgi:Ca-activated chloride channel homolog